MPSITIKRSVVLRSIVTERLKAELQEELQEAAEEIDQRLAQIDFSTKPYVTELQRTNLQQAMQVRKHIEQEKRKQQDVRDALMQRKAQVAELVLGSEVIRGTLESWVEVKEGDNLAELLGGVEIVAKDDVVIEIRQRKPSDADDETPAPTIIIPGRDEG